jgi:cytosine deaminase
MEKDKFMHLAIDQAKKSFSEGGIPIGSVLVKNGELVAAGHNKRVQEKNPTLWYEDIGKP